SKKADGNGLYEMGDFTPFPANYFNGTKWDWPTGNPPNTELTASGGMPSGENGNPANPIHWAIRRYVSEADGPLRISGILACVSTNNSSANIPGTCGDGVVGHIYVDGVEVYNQTVFGVSLGYSIVVNASLGSVIDFALDPGAAANDLCDTNAVFTAIVRTSGGANPVADTVSDWSQSGVQGQNGWTYGY